MSIIYILKHDEKFEPSDPHIFVKTPLYFLFYLFEIPEIFPYKTPDLEYVNFATPCIRSQGETVIDYGIVNEEEWKKV
jgi:hypothetical protein